jgi:hypothetical protein
LRLGSQKGVPGSTVDSKESNNIPNAGAFDVLHVVGVHPHQTTNLELFLGPDVVEIRSFVELTLVDPHVSQLTVLSVFQFEGQGDGRLIVGYFNF